MDRCRHVWLTAPGPDKFALRCEGCSAWVSVAVASKPVDRLVYRFRCLGGTDPLVADADFRELGEWLRRVTGGVQLYAGPARVASAGAVKRRRRRVRSAA